MTSLFDMLLSYAATELSQEEDEHTDFSAALAVRQSSGHAGTRNFRPLDLARLSVVFFALQVHAAAFRHLHVPRVCGRRHVQPFQVGGAPTVAPKTAPSMGAQLSKVPRMGMSIKIARA